MYRIMHTCLECVSEEVRGCECYLCARVRVHVFVCLLVWCVCVSVCETVLVENGLYCKVSKISVKYCKSVITR